jgi:glycosyltransferase involved in cell wall biosynthesis
MPEIIREGTNGFLVASVDSAVAAVADAVGIDRGAVRESVSRRFDVARMVDDYLAVYQQIVNPNSGEVAE